MTYTLANDGDAIEKQLYNWFLSSRFPSYEKFWILFVVPLTNRPYDITLKSDQQLTRDYPKESINKIHERLCIAQLHYSALNFLKAAFEGKDTASKDFDGIVKCFSNLYSALDITAELFGRYVRLINSETITDDAFSPESVGDSMKVRRNWQNRVNPYPTNVQAIRDYRDNLIHGRMMFYSITPTAGYIALPKIGKEKDYFDWRKSLIGFQTGSSHADLNWSGDMTNTAFDTVIAYLENMWQQFLLK